MTINGTNFRAILQRHQQEAPIKVGALAADLGLRVLISELPPSVSGKLSRESEASEQDWVIKVNRHEHKNRQRFTIAHEIAHFVLHRTEIVGNELVDDTFYRSGLSDRREWEANQLAAEILMPWHLIRSEMSDGKKSPAELAQKFGVSEAAMHIRLGLPT